MQLHTYSGFDERERERERESCIEAVLMLSTTTFLEAIRCGFLY